MEIETYTEEPEYDTERQAAFEQGAQQWRGHILQPFSISRRAIFLAWRAAQGELPMSKLISAEADGDAFLADALRLIWLCIIPKDHLQLIRNDPRVMQAECDAWADQHIALTIATEAIITGLKIWNGSFINQHAVEPNPDATEHAKK